MKDLNQLFLIIEEKRFEKLYLACKELFTKTNIPSHDHEHHKRVWNICKEIIVELNKTKEIDPSLLETCIIASFFHDTGLTKTLSENHGRESRLLCVKYFNENHIEKPENYDLILDAIEKHDDKEYKSKHSDPYSLLSILCSADDLDAFGRIGVVRYTEIYLLRGIELNKLPQAVIDNLDKRFANFKKHYGFIPILYKKYEIQYLITRDFFEEMDKEFKKF